MEEQEQVINFKIAEITEKRIALEKIKKRTQSVRSDLGYNIPGYSTGYNGIGLAKARDFEQIEEAAMLLEKSGRSEAANRLREDMARIQLLSVNLHEWLGEVSKELQDEIDRQKDLQQRALTWLRDQPLPKEFQEEASYGF